MASALRCTRGAFHTHVPVLMPPVRQLGGIFLFATEPTAWSAVHSNSSVLNAKTTQSVKPCSSHEVRCCDRATTA